jgi:hypothetical protein
VDAAARHDVALVPLCVKRGGMRVVEFAGFSDYNAPILASDARAIPRACALSPPVTRASRST